MGAISPGDIVVPRMRFALNSRRVGLVIGGSDDGWVVMWVKGGAVEFTAHVGAALTPVGASNVDRVMDRTRLLT